MTTFEFENFKVNAMPYVRDEYLCTVHLHNGLKYEDKISECFTALLCERDLIYSLVSPAAKNGKDKVETLIECAQDLTQMIYKDVYDKIEDHTQALRSIVQLAAEFEEIWWNTPESERDGYLDTLEEFAKGTLHPINLDSLHIEDRDIIQVISTPEGKQIKYLGYFYKADNEWRSVCICDFQVPLDEWKRMSSEEICDKASECKQYISDYKEYELKSLLKCYLSFRAVSLPDEFLNEDTPDGVYII